MDHQSLWLVGLLLLCGSSSYPVLPCIGLLVLLLCVMELVLDVKLSIFGQCMLVLLLLELLLVGSGLLAVTGAVVCMDCVSMLVCSVSYGSSGIVSRYLVMQSGLSVFLWLCMAIGSPSGLLVLWLLKVGAGVG